MSFKRVESLFLVAVFSMQVLMSKSQVSLVRKSRLETHGQLNVTVDQAEAPTLLSLENITDLKNQDEKLNESAIVPSILKAKGGKVGVGSRGNSRYKYRGTGGGYYGGSLPGSKSKQECSTIWCKTWFWGTLAFFAFGWIMIRSCMSKPK